ncbi:hypothetical protein DRB89_34365 [Streptomyces sp. ICC4]|nr:hypothetical protein DRB89_34365 [Streptomyces sp. ICC4]
MGTSLWFAPCGAADAGALVEVFRDPALRHWLTRHVDGVEDARSWLGEQRLGWASGKRGGLRCRAR